LLHRRWPWVQNTELRAPAQSFGVDRAVACGRLRPRRGAKAGDDSGSMCRSRRSRRVEGMNDEPRTRDPLSWPLIVGLSSLALLWPLTGLWPVLGEGPLRAFVLIGITGAVWIGTVGFARVARPVSGGLRAPGRAAPVPPCSWRSFPAWRWVRESVAWPVWLPRASRRCSVGGRNDETAQTRGGRGRLAVRRGRSGRMRGLDHLG